MNFIDTNSKVWFKLTPSGIIRLTQHYRKISAITAKPQEMFESLMKETRKENGWYELDMGYVMQIFGSMVVGPSTEEGPFEDHDGHQIWLQQPTDCV